MVEEDRSLAFEVKGRRLRVLLEDSLPYVMVCGERYFVGEPASVVIKGKKYFVEGLV